MAQPYEITSGGGGPDLSSRIVYPYPVTDVSECQGYNDCLSVKINRDKKDSFNLLVKTLNIAGVDTESD